MLKIPCVDVVGSALCTDLCNYTMLKGQHF